MKDFITFNNNGIKCKEEILFYRYLNQDPGALCVLTPSGIYKYEQSPVEYNTDNLDMPRIIKAVNYSFYKYVGTITDCYHYFGETEKLIRLNWEPI